VREAMDLTRPGADAAGVSVELVVSASPATVRGDAGELRQVAANLLQNAVKYGASGKRITISLRDALEGGVRMIEMEVRDYGPGIAPVHLPRLTERFYRDDEGSNPLDSGTGLGLAIVKHIVARHRGRLLIDSRPGEGASFAIRIPFLAKPEVLPVPLDKTMEDQLRKLSHD
jgi:two-component system, OmpR family, phosphate regulon sensor histidine kinase PhoR